MPDANQFFTTANSLAMATAIEQGDIAQMQALVLSVDINAKHRRGMTYLMWSVANLQLASAKTLLALGADSSIDVEDVSYLSFAMNAEDISWLQAFVDNGGDLQQMKKGSPVWFDVIYSQRWTHLDYLIEQGVDINAVSDSGNSLILKLASLDEYAQIEKLINLGANIKQTNSAGVSFAYSVQASQLSPKSPQYLYREKVIAQLSQQGIQLPVPAPREVLKQRRSLAH